MERAETIVVRKGLGVRLVALTVSFFAIFGIVLSGLAWLRARFDLEHALHGRGVALAVNLASNAAFGVRVADLESVENLLSAILEHEDMLYVVVHDAEGATFATKRQAKTTAAPPAAPKSPPDRTVVVRVNGDVDEVQAPIIATPISIEGEATGKPVRVGYVRLGLSREGLAAKLRDAMLTSGAVVIIAVLLAFFGLGRLIRPLVQPLGEMALAAQGIAAGKLSTKIDETHQGELGVLARAFAGMARSLRQTISDFRNVASKTRDTSADVRAQAAEVVQKAQSQVASADNAFRAVANIEASSKNVAESVSRLAAAADVSSTSLDDMRGQIALVTTNANDLAANAEGATVGMVEMARSIQQVGKAIGTLAGAAEQTISAVQEISSSLKSVEQQAQTATQLSEEVANEAETQGIDAVERNIEGMERIKETVNTSVTAMRRLGARAEQIGEVLNVINDVNEQVNLLALNASIIAAQAGEHGRGFSVVAGEIKALARRTSTSTGEIADQIAGMQKESRDALSSIASGEERVADGVRLAGETERVLRAILERSRISALTARSIETSTSQQTVGMSQIANAMEQIGVMVEDITRTSKQQTASAERTRQSADDMRKSAGEAQRAVQSLADASTQIAGAVDEVRNMIRDILDATEKQERGSAELGRDIATIRDAARAALVTIEKMTGDIGELGKGTETLLVSVLHFEA